MKSQKKRNTHTFRQAAMKAADKSIPSPQHPGHRTDGAISSSAEQRLGHMYQTSPLVRKRVGCERGAEGCVPLTGEVKKKRTPLISPLPNTEAFTQRGLSALVESNDAATEINRPLS